MDAVRFERLVQQALRADASATATERTLDDLDGALSLWRGDPLTDVAEHEWASGEIARLEETIDGLLDRLGVRG